MRWQIFFFFSPRFRDFRCNLKRLSGPSVFYRRRDSRRDQLMRFLSSLFQCSSLFYFFKLQDKVNGSLTKSSLFFFCIWVDIDFVCWILKLPLTIMFINFQQIVILLSMNSMLLLLNIKKNLICAFSQKKTLFIEKRFFTLLNFFHCLGQLEIFTASKITRIFWFGFSQKKIMTNFFLNLIIGYVLSNKNCMVMVKVGQNS